jgi:hypothetical protein
MNVCHCINPSPMCPCQRHVPPAPLWPPQTAAYPRQLWWYPQPWRPSIYVTGATTNIRYYPKPDIPAMRPEEV